MSDFALADFAAIAVRKWRSSVGTLGAGYRRCNMKTCPEEQKIVLRGEMMLGAELALAPGM